MRKFSTSLSYLLKALVHPVVDRLEFVAEVPDFPSYLLAEVPDFPAYLLTEVLGFSSYLLKALVHPVIDRPEFTADILEGDNHLLHLPFQPPQPGFVGIGCRRHCGLYIK